MGVAIGKYGNQEIIFYEIHRQIHHPKHTTFQCHHLEDLLYGP
jgi:hypothetical protein